MTLHMKETYAGGGAPALKEKKMKEMVSFCRRLSLEQFVWFLRWINGRSIVVIQECCVHCAGTEQATE